MSVLIPLTSSDYFCACSAKSLFTVTVFSGYLRLILAFRVTFTSLLKSNIHGHRRKLWTGLFGREKLQLPPTAPLPLPIPINPTDAVG